MKHNTDFEIKPLIDWNIKYSNRPLVIAGPCSAESLEQVLETGKLLKKNGINIFRAGIWKPRTRPGSFEGVGNIGLTWLKILKNQTDLLTCIEVASAKHVEAALNADIDILWVGARTSANPFATQEIADALKGVDVPVFVKNPVNPDLELWIGAIERINKSGIKKLGAIHRGFSNYESSIYRNPPMWQLPIELKRRIPQIPILCDPSHISGKRELLLSISQKALDLNYDGLIIESHLNPEKALSDSNQQITPNGLENLIKSLILRQVNPKGISLETLEDLRYKISNLDFELIDILHKRMQISEAIGYYKKQNNMTILQPKRWNEILRMTLKYGCKKNLSKNFIIKLFKAIHEESINKQVKIMNND